MFDTDTGTGRISFVDPNGKTGKAGITRPGESLVTDYMVNNQVTRIVGAVAESPVPEPSTVLLLGSAVAAAGSRAWRRHRRARLHIPKTMGRTFSRHCRICRMRAHRAACRHVSFLARARTRAQAARRVWPVAS